MTDTILRRRGGDPVIAVSTARIGFGVLVAVAPALVPRLLGVDRQTAQRIGWLPRLVAGREIALGAGTLLARRKGTDTGYWMAAQAVADGTDGLAILAALRHGHVNRVTGVLFVLFAAAGVSLSTVAALTTDPA